MASQPSDPEMETTMSKLKKRRLSFPAQNTQDLADDLGRGLLFNEATADIILKVQDERLPAHRAVLAARSEYFQALLYGGMQESVAKEVQLNDHFSPLVTRLLLRYIYTQQLDAAALEDAFELMACANHYGINKLREAMQCQVVESISKDTVFVVWALAAEHQQEELIEKCLQVVHASPATVFDSDLFLELDQPSLLRVIESDKDQEEPVHYFRAVARWCRHWSTLLGQGGERAAEAGRHLGPNGSQVHQLFGSIRYGRMTQRDLQCEVRALVDQKIVPLEVYARALEQQMRQMDCDAKSLSRCKQIAVGYGWLTHLINRSGRKDTLITPTTQRTRFTMEWLGGELQPELAVISPLRRKLLRWCSGWWGGFVLDVVMPPATDGIQEVTFYGRTADSTIELRQRCYSPPFPFQLALLLRNKDDSVFVESLP